jgi:hypothetical protein
MWIGKLGKDVGRRDGEKVVKGYRDTVGKVK